jgi:hypothetical protein
MFSLQYNRILIWSADFSKSLRCQIRPVGAELFPAVGRSDGRTYMTKLIVAFRTCLVQDPRKWSSRRAVSSHTCATRVDGVLLRSSVTTDCLLVMKPLICTWRPASSILCSHHVTLQTPARSCNKTITWSHWTHFFGGGGNTPFQYLFSLKIVFVSWIEEGKYKIWVGLGRGKRCKYY